ncbi:MAG: hypothetical protein RIC06_21455 [Cyclobacteriaceae bacterium]
MNRKVTSLIRLHLAIVLFALISVNGSAQGLPNIQEEVHMHLNSSSLITGETLLFSADVVSAQTNKHSHLSAILYVEIVDKDLKPIYQAKIRLLEGKGYGDFFIPSLVPTGSYQLIAYTRWMRNFNQFYHHPLHIVNPFEVYTPNQESDLLSVQFYPEGGNLVNGVQNTMAVEVKDYQERGLDFNGRVVDQEGTVIANVSSTLPGFATFTYTPQDSDQYQLIIEDLNGNFQFFEIPEVRLERHAIQVTVKDRYFLAQIACDCGDAVQFQVFNGPRKILEKEVRSNEEFNLSKYELGEGTFLLIALKDGVNVSRRIIYNSPQQMPLREFNNQPYNNRTLVSLPINFEDETRFSVSVNKVNDYGIPLHLNSSEKLLKGVNELHRFDTNLLFDPKSEELVNELMIASTWKLEESPEDILLLPDHRGEMVSGQVVAPDSLDLGNEFVAYSIIGKEYQIKIAPVMSDGSFNMVVEPLEEDRSAYITGMDNLTADMIEIAPQFLQSHPELEFPPLILDSATVGAIVKRSIRNQIENAYFDVKADSITEPKPYIEQFGRFDYYYVLDDYNRFPTIRESFIEYIPMVAVRGKEPSLAFRVSLKTLIKPKLEPYAFLDGLPVKSEEILAFSPYRIESIGVINNRYFLGPRVIDGIISFRTKEGNLQGFVPGPQSRELKYEGVSPAKTYTFPVYGNNEIGESDLSAKIPDYRDQLYWNPDAEADPGSVYNIEFFTSDTKGRFEVAIEGVTTEGEHVSLRKYFTVE